MWISYLGLDWFKATVLTHEVTPLARGGAKAVGRNSRTHRTSRGSFEMARQDWGMDGCFKRGRDSPKKNLFTTSRVPSPVSLMEGSFFVTPEQIRFVELKGKVGDSPITLSGAFSQTAPPSPVASKKLEKAQAWPNRSEDFPSKSLLPTWTSIRSFQRKRTLPNFLRKNKGWLLKLVGRWQGGGW